MLQVRMPDGSEWQVPATLVAEPRARYYAEHDTSQSSGEAFDKEYADELGHQSDDDLIDWAQNNMNWEDVEPNATMVITPDPHVDYQDGWVNGEMRLVDR